MRDAEAEPEEPTAAVVPGAIRTSSVPSSVRATCRITFVTPCPTSAAAQCTSAEPSSNKRTRAAQESSKPSEYARFLKPTAKPTPRFTPSPRVVFPGAAGQADRRARQLLRLGLGAGPRSGGSPRRPAASP